MDAMTKNIYKLMYRYASYRPSRICRHSVMLDLLMILQKSDMIAEEDVRILAKAFCDATTLLEDYTTGDDASIKDKDRAEEQVRLLELERGGQNGEYHYHFSYRSGFVIE